MHVQLDMSSDNQTNNAPDAPYSMPGDAQVPMSEDPPELNELADSDVNGIIASTIRELPEGEYQSHGTSLEFSYLCALSLHSNP
jgi:hypothetical protein